MSPTHCCDVEEVGRGTVPRPTQPWDVGTIYEVLPKRLSFTSHRDNDHSIEQIKAFPHKFFITNTFQSRYLPFCYDFGPVDLGRVHSFCEFMRQLLNCPELQEREIIYYCEECIELRTNTAFLLAAFLVLQHAHTPDEAWAPFACIEGEAFLTFRDVAWRPTEPESQQYSLSILDCLRGLHKAVACRWYSCDSFDADDYEYLQNPSNADMHTCTPKLIAFRSPTKKRTLITQGMHSFQPMHFTELFHEKGVTAVVRLNQSDVYDASDFTKADFRHYDLYHDIATMPSADLVEKFINIVETEPGSVAVHCQNGLGRTGVLIAAYIMKLHGFTARESIGWLRIVRPGMVIGQQQQYLETMEVSMRNSTEATSTDLTTFLAATTVHTTAMEPAADETEVQ